MATSTKRKSDVYAEKYLQMNPLRDLRALHIMCMVFRVLGWSSIVSGVWGSIGFAGFVNDWGNNFGLTVLAFFVVCLISGITACMLFCISEIISLSRQQLSSAMMRRNRVFSRASAMGIW